MSEPDDYERKLRAAFAKSLKRGRHELDLSKQALAARAAVSQKVLCGIERGDTNTTLHTMAKLALAVGLEVPAMLRRADPAAPG